MKNTIFLIFALPAFGQIVAISHRGEHLQRPDRPGPLVDWLRSKGYKK